MGLLNDHSKTIRLTDKLSSMRQCDKQLSQFDLLKQRFDKHVVLSFWKGPPWKQLGVKCIAGPSVWILIFHLKCQVTNCCNVPLAFVLYLEIWPTIMKQEFRDFRSLQKILVIFQNRSVFHRSQKLNWSYSLYLLQFVSEKEFFQGNLTVSNPIAQCFKYKTFGNSQDLTQLSAAIRSKKIWKLKWFRSELTKSFEKVKKNPEKT